MEAKCFRGRQLEVSVSHHGCLASAFHTGCGLEFMLENTEAIKFLYKSKKNVDHKIKH